MFRILYSLTLIIFCLSCNKPLVAEKCTVIRQINHTLHSSAANSDKLNNDDPNDDLDELHEGSFYQGATYNISLQIGNGQQIDVVADTGSSDLVISSQNYQPSQTSRNLNQSLPLSYSSCKGSSSLYSDNIGLACGNEAVNQTFALLASSSAADSCPNIMGLAYANLAATKTTFFDDLVKFNKMENLFTMVLCGMNPGSQIVLGGQPSKAPDAESIQYTPIVEENYYVINAGAFGVKGGSNLGTLSGHHVILDSGTTLSKLPQTLHDTIVAAINSARPDLTTSYPGFFTATKPSDKDYSLNSKELGDISKLPTFTLEFAGVYNNPSFSLDIPPEIYLKQLTADLFVFGFRVSQEGEKIILGQTLMDNYYIVFDRANKRIGFASNAGFCSKPSA